MPRSSKRDNGVAAALAIHLCVYCAVAACFALALFYLMQPTRLPNPGMAAHKSSPRVLNYVEWLRSEREAAKRDVRFEPEPETTGAAERQAPEVKPDVKKAPASRPRPARRPQSAEPTTFAQQPSFEGYRPMY
jgi:hypothetical protein